MIRLLNENDSEQFRKLRFQTLADDIKSWTSTLESEVDKPDSYLTSVINYSLIPPYFGFYGYFENNVLLAYAQLSPNYRPKKKHIINIFEVCVDKNQRSKGIGRSLVTFLINIAKNVPGAERIDLYVNSDNTSAIKFYESLGFKKLTTIPKSVKESDGSYQDEYLYSLKI